MNIKKKWTLLFIVITATIIFTLLAAPTNNRFLAGSTFGKNPNGYGAWYQYMLNQGVAIERWQKPFAELKSLDNKISYLRVLQPQIRLFHRLSKVESQWIKQGNTMIILGVDSQATSASFTTTQSYNNLDIKIATTRRHKKPDINSILQDDYGSIVWQENMGQGKIIYAVTPYIAANAYQNNPDNFQFLAELVQANPRVLVDEYIHGYKDQEVIEQEREKGKKASLINYFSKTVWLPISSQIIIITLIAIASNLRRFGQPTLIPKTQIDNSQAYIEALAGVLEKAECSKFAIQTIIKDEKRRLKQFLGLGKTNISDEILLNEWQKITGKDPTPLKKLLQYSQNKSHLNYSQFLKWLQQWQQYHQR